MKKIKLFLLMICVFSVSNLCFASDLPKIADEKAHLSEIRTNVLETIPREPKHVDSSDSNYIKIENAFKMITKYRLGRFEEIQNLLIHWSERTSFSSPPTSHIHREGYKEAVFTMPNDKIFEVYTENLPHRIKSVANLFVQKMDIQMLTIKMVDVLKESRNVVKSQQKRSKNNKGSKSKSTSKANNSNHLGLRYFQLINGFEWMTKHANSDTKAIMRETLNKNLKDPKNVFFPPKNGYGGGLSLGSFLEIIDNLNWQKLKPFLRDISNGEYDQRINNFKKHSWKLNDIKERATKILSKKEDN